MNARPASARPGLAVARTPEVPVRAWRVTTAVRVFVLALATGQVVGAGTLAGIGGVLLGLALLAAGCCVVELRWERGTVGVPAVEGAVAAVLVGLPAGPAEPLLVCLAVPAMVSGFRQGAGASLRVSAFVSAIVLALALVGPGTAHGWSWAASAMPWLLIGLGAGLLSAAQTRSVRRLEAAQAPYAAAHRLVGQLHDLAHLLPMGLDVPSHARALQASIREAAGAERSTVLVGTERGGLERLACDGEAGPAEEEVARRCLATRARVHRSAHVALPLRVGEHVFGAVVLTGADAGVASNLDSLQERVDEQAIRLDTALLVENVRLLATTEERNRLARDLHDGVAQQVVGLAYLTDDLAALSKDPAALRGLDELRDEVSRLVSALRFSVFDLRHEVDHDGGLATALSDYLRQLGSHSGLRVHLMLDERSPRLSRRVEEELLSIAREAIGNVRRHAQAINLWVSLTVSGTEARLVVEDDGVGAALPRPGHYGMHTMRERAERIGACLEVTDRPDGGTVVALRPRTSTTTTEREAGHDQRLARR